MLPPVFPSEIRGSGYHPRDELDRLEKIGPVHRFPMTLGEFEFRKNFPTWWAEQLRGFARAVSRELKGMSPTAEMFNALPQADGHP